MIFIGANKWLKTLLLTVFMRAATAIDGIPPSDFGLSVEEKRKSRLDWMMFFESRLEKEKRSGW